MIGAAMGLVIAGAFTLLPSRIMGQVVVRLTATPPRLVMKASFSNSETSCSFLSTRHAAAG